MLVKDKINVFESRTKELSLEANGYGIKTPEDTASVKSEAEQIFKNIRYKLAASEKKGASLKSTKQLKAK